MSFFTRAATTALTGLAIFGFASAAFAHHVEQRPFNQKDVVELLNVVEATGHRVFRGGGPCDEQPLFGLATRTRELVICVENHGNNMDELADTVRHEALHLAQFCKARSVGASIALLSPEDSEHYLDDARDYLHMPVSSYPDQQLVFEAEARVLAYALSEEQVARVLVHECGLEAGL